MILKEQLLIYNTYTWKKKQHNLKYGIYKEELLTESIVLLHDTRCKKDKSYKLFFRWLGPYQICNTVKDKGMYMLKELDVSQLIGIFIGNRLKKFHLRQQLQLDHVTNLDYEKISTINDFFIGNNDSDLSDVPDTLSAIW